MPTNSSIADHLARQRWYGGGGEPPESVTVETDELVHPGPTPLHRLVVRANGSRYQLLLGARQAMPEPDFLHGRDDLVVSIEDGTVTYDALADPELAHVLLHVVTDGNEKAELVRPLGVEQSNTSLVYDDRLVLKVMRRLVSGPNPEVEVTTALATDGFEHVAEPVAVWRAGDDDLGILQRYLVGHTDGWALALTSLRDLYATGGDPSLAGGDFAAEARRLGEVTASLHLALAHAFGTLPGRSDEWAESLRRTLADLGDAARFEGDVVRAFDELAAVAEPGRAGRVHGDYHLGQVLRTDAGWFVVDFEGEPARPLAERRRPASPLRDVAGMLRSFHYATWVTLGERDEAERRRCLLLAEDWEARNRAAFLDGYCGTDGIVDLLPPSGDRERVLRALELEKALYELRYERSHRPDWEAIPLAGIERIVSPWVARP